jgi:hypothetical protein
MYNGMGGYKYGLRGVQPGCCVVSSVGSVVMYCEVKKRPCGCINIPQAGRSGQVLALGGWLAE